MSNGALWMIHCAPRANSTNSAATSAKARLVAEHFPREAVDVGRTGVDLALGIDVDVQVAAGRPAVDQFDDADLDDAMALPGIESGRLGVEDELAHECLAAV